MGSIAEFKSDVNQKTIKFYVNGEAQIIKDEYPLTTSLSSYLRNVMRLTGTKVFCNEGGCGCCVINAKRLDERTNEHVDTSINSCLFPLYSCDGYSFTTIEGIGNKSTSLHPIQKRLADANGSQCGYCSPGFVMSVYSLLKNNSKPTRQEIEDSLDGNICRCTGYRAIVDAMKSFSVEDQPLDIEDLLNLKCINGDPKNNNGCNGSCFNPEPTPATSFFTSKDNIEWYTVDNLNDLININKKLNQQNKVKFVSGNTCVGVFKNDGPFDTFINVKNVKELNVVEKKENQLIIGSGITISSLGDIFKKYSSQDPNSFGHLKGLVGHVNKIGNIHVRNAASWSGNLVMKKEHEFPSDVLVILEAANAKLNVINLSGTETKLNLTELSLNDFLNADYLETSRYLIHSMTLPSLNQAQTKIKSFKVSPRAINSHSYVNAAFRFQFESADSLKLTQSPVITFNGLAKQFFHATETEKYLLNQDLSNETVLNESIAILEKELKSSGVYDKVHPLEATPDYRIALALSLYYKFILECNLISSAKIKAEYKTAIDCLIDSRPVSRAEQNYEKSESLFPLTQPMPKINSYSQTSGETKYVDDLSPLSFQLDGAFILTKVANARIASINTDKAMKLPGVVRIFLAKDIPGENNFMTSQFKPEPLFAESQVLYAGQPVGLVVAQTYDLAKQAAELVEIVYVDVKKPIISIRDAIRENCFQEELANPLPDIVKGDAPAAISKAKHKISGEVDIDSSQFNFYVEGIIGICEPTEDGYKIECTAQWLDSVQRSVANVLGIKNSSCIDVQIKQIGGGFGGKTTRANIVATAASVAAHHLRKPVKIFMDLNDCMDMLGKRPPWYVKYEVGFDDDGKLDGVSYEWFSDPGWSGNGSLLAFCPTFSEAGYKCDNYLIKSKLVKTNKPASTEVRSPDIFTSICVTEQVLGHVATYLNKEPLEVRQVNLFRKGDVTLSGQVLRNIELDVLVNKLKESSKYLERKDEIAQFNKTNRFKKRGISLIPIRYCLTYNLGYYNALVTIRHHDGSVAISHGGIEMGQGVHTKVAQVCAHELGIPIEKISVKNTNNLVNPNNLWSGGSVVSELCCKTVIECCKTLKDTLEPFKKMLPENHTWEDLVSKAFAMCANLSAMYQQRTDPTTIREFVTYDTEAAACTEVMIDVLTGETQVLRTDILYDGGKTMNGLIDVGQAEGGFIMGLGYMLMEKTVYDPETGRCLNNGTWDYKPPLVKDIPVDFRITFLENKPNEVGVLGSKAVGEPPLLLSSSILFALREAINSAREDKGVRGHFKLDLPATPETVQQACLVDSSLFKFSV